jgi:glycosyltransferase involved in cell wall biosynthesis
MKILHAIYNLTTGGAETMLIDILNQQCRKASVSLIIVNDKVDENLLATIDKSVKVYIIGRQESRKMQLFTAFFKINRLLITLKPDAIHCHDNKLFPFFIRYRSKTFLTIHSVRLYDRFLKYYRRVFAISAAVKEDLKKRSGVDAQIVLNGIEIAEYQKRADYRYNPVSDIFKVVLLSRLFPQQKGQDIAIQAIAFMKERYPEVNITLTLVGDGEALSSLKAQSQQCNVDDRVVFAGQASRQWVKEHLKDYHLLIQPSRVEGFGLTVIEGFAAGLPVIASNLDGPKEIFDTLGIGLPTEIGNAEDLAEKIHDVYASYCSGNLLKTNYLPADQSHLKQFDIQTTAENYLKEYLAIR